MHAYYDTGALIPLYLVEVFSSTVSAFVAARGEPIPMNAFQRLELENAIRQKVFRREIDVDQQNQVLSDAEADLNRGRFILRPVNWPAALDTARQIAARVTARTGCRTLDLVHVAVAVQWGCAIFVTADGRQFQAARREGLRAVDVCELHRRGGGDGRAEPKTVGEPRARYGSRRRPRGG